MDVASLALQGCLQDGTVVHALLKAWHFVDQSEVRWELRRFLLPIVNAESTFETAKWLRDNNNTITSFLATAGLEREHSIFPSLKAARAQGTAADLRTQSEWAVSTVFAVGLLAWISGSPRRQCREIARVLLYNLFVNALLPANAKLDLLGLISRHGSMCTDEEDALHHCVHIRNLVHNELRGIAPQEKLASFLVNLVAFADCEAIRGVMQEVLRRVA
eukprot:8876727-Lingulodinium_polyedra.AAC.1